MCLHKDCEFKKIDIYAFKINKKGGFQVGLWKLDYTDITDKRYDKAKVIRSFFKSPNCPLLMNVHYMNGIYSII